MRKFTIFILSIFMIICLSGCGKNSGNSSVMEKVSEVKIEHCGEYSIYEWVSPDGVHYWAIPCAYGIGISPRYDNDGNLIIDKE